MGKIRRIERVKNHIHKYTKHTQKIFTNLTGVVFKHKKRSLAYTILTPTLFTCAVCLFFYGVNVSASSYVAKYVGAAVNGTWVKVDSTGNVNIEIVPTASGTLGIGKDNVSVETNANTGYRLYLSGINSEPNGYTALYRNGNPSDVSKFTSVTADPTSPSSLTNGQWGWALPSSAGTGTSPSTDANAFPSTTIYEDISTTGSTTDSSVISNLKFAGIKQNYSFIKSTNTSNENNPDNLNIYYGALADNSMTIGSYYNVIVYTAFVEGADTISVSPNAIQDNGTMTISTNIQGNANPITPEQIEITLYDPSDDTKNIGTCDNISISDEHNGTVEKPLEISCTFHANANTMRNVSYGVRLKIDPKGNGIYLSYTAADSWKYGKPLDQITYMQDVTATDCAVTPTWDDSNITYTLTDRRETPNKSYLVRKLKDNNCWMVQNLALQGNTTIYGPGVAGHEQDSDLPEGVSYTLPDGNGYAGKFIKENDSSFVYDSTHEDNTIDNDSSNTGAYYSFIAAVGSRIDAKIDISDDPFSVSESGLKTLWRLPYSICPKGWELPTSGAGSLGIVRLFNSYGNDDFTDAWSVGTRSGFISASILRGGNWTGRWWSADSPDTPTFAAWGIFYDSTSTSVSVGSWGGGYAYYGMHVRCVAAGE